MATDIAKYTEGDHPIYFKRITFAASGEPEMIQFENHAELSTTNVIFTAPLDTYGPDEFVFYGVASDHGKPTDITIRGSRIQWITFGKAPQKRPANLR
jgi:hypothetical protein